MAKTMLNLRRFNQNSHPVWAKMMILFHFSLDLEESIDQEAVIELTLQ